MIRSQRRQGGAVAAPLLLVLAACGGGSSPEVTPSPTATPAAARPSPALPPLPAAGEGGVAARHGGLVVKAGDGWIELAVADGVAQVYLYDAGGAARSAAGLTGELVVTPAKGSPSTVALAPLTGSEALAGGRGLPDRFQARVTVRGGGGEWTATLVHARHGEPGTWSQPR